MYNASNIDRVRRDEAAAAALEAASEQRMQEDDAARRLAILRGEEPPPLPADEPEALLPATTDRGSDFRPGARRKRKRAGEDDTDFEMRVAKEQVTTGKEVAQRLRGTGPVDGSAGTETLVDAAGHISLFGPAAAEDGVAGRKAEEAERRAAKKRREEEDMRATRFSDAAGRGGLGLTDGGPWYAKAQGEKGDGAVVEFEAPTKNVWGNEDPRRKERAAARIGANDPLAMMKKGAAKVRELGKERKRDAEERERELERLRKEERRREKKRRRRKEGREHDDVDNLEGFSLDAPRSERERSERRRPTSHHGEEGHRSERDGRLDEKGARYSRRSEDDRHRDSHSRHRHSKR